MTCGGVDRVGRATSPAVHAGMSLRLLVARRKDCQESPAAGPKECWTPRASNASRALIHTAKFGDAVRSVETPPVKKIMVAPAAGI